MKKPYEACRNSPLWKVIEKELLVLEDNQDLEITTQRELVIGSIVKAIEDSEIFEKVRKSYSQKVLK